MYRYFIKCISGSFLRTIGRILAYAAVGVLIYLLSSKMLIAHAYVYVETYEPTLRFEPTNKYILDVKQNWGTGKYINTGSYTSTWLVSPGQFWYAGAVNGTYLNVSADYYLGIKAVAYTDSLVYDYLSSARNTIRSGTLRCGIGDFKTGFDSTFLPEVSNFEATLTEGFPAAGGTQYLFHIKFDYKQQIRSVNLNNTNMSCWFEQSPSNGLFALPTWFQSYQDIQYFYYNVDFKYSVSTDPNTGILTGIQNLQEDLNNKLHTQIDQNDKTNSNLEVQINQNQTIIDQNNQTNGKLDDLNDNLTDSDTSGANQDANNFFNDFEDNDYGFSDIVKMPLQLINKLTSAKCTPLSFPLPFVKTDVTLPCMYDIYQKYFGSILTVYQTITFGIVAYWVCMNLFRMVKNFKNPDNDEIEVLDL